MTYFDLRSDLFISQKIFMVRLLFSKWWVLLLQGILLLVLAFYISNHPEATLAGLTFWISLLVLGAGLTGLVGWLMQSKNEKETADLVWSLASALFGLVLLAKLQFAMQLLTNILGIWMIITGVWVLRNGWQYRQSGGSGWAMIIAGLLSIVAGFFVIFDLAAGAIAITTLLAIQLVLAGVALILLALLKRSIIGKLKTVTNQFKSAS